MENIIRNWVNRNIQGIPFNSTVTDNFFLKVEGDNSLLQDYRDFVSSYGLKAVNSLIGRLIKTENNLHNTGREISPRSSLIKSYTLH